MRAPFVPTVPELADTALVRALAARLAELDAENAALRERVAELVEYERLRAYDRAERATRRRWKGLDR